MARLQNEAVATAQTTLISAYDQDKWSLGTLIRKRTDGAVPYIGPIVPAVARPVETSAAIPGIYPHVVQWSPDIDWVFLADNAGAATTRRIQLYTFNRSTGAWGWKGFITISYSGGTNVTLRGIRASYEKYTTGTVSVSGTAVTGTSTLWVTNRMCSGCRIGFGSTDPTQIGTWYEIASIGGEGSITLTGAAATFGGGTPYVIEDLRILQATTNATTTNGGLYVVKGIQYETFTTGGTSVALAATTDNVRANFWLADAATVTNITAAGVAIDAKTDWINQDCYILDLVSAGNYKVYKYNVRKALTLTAGKDTTCLLLQTGNNAFTGTGSQTNNHRLGTLNHGPQAGVKCLYFVSTTRIMAAPVSGIVAASTTWIASTMTEVPPGSTTTFAATGAMASVEISDTLDRLLVITSGATAFRSYVTQFRTDGGQMDQIFGSDDKQLDQSTVDAGTQPHLTTNSVQQTSWSEGGMVYFAGVGTTAITNLLRAFPFGADWAYAATTQQRAISPRIATPGAQKYWRVGANEVSLRGSATLGMSTDSYRLYYRTSGISDNSGAWNAINDMGDLSGVAGASEIQFMVEFRCIGLGGVPGAICALQVAYEDTSTDSHYQPSVANSDKTNKRFAWRFSTAFGGAVPTLRVRLYDAVSGGLLVNDTTSGPTGTWEKSTNGGSSWDAYDTTDKGNETTYIRYTPASLGDNIRVRALLTLA